jgi:hypothetical protein
VTDSPVGDLWHVLVVDDDDAIRRADGGGRAAGGDYLELARIFGADGTLSTPISTGDLRTVISQVMRVD